MRDRVLVEAEFDPRVKDYWLMLGVVVLVATVFGAPLALIWYFGGRVLCQKWLDRLSVTLTTRSLKINKGLLNRIEKTIPLDKITDLAIYQGPIMRLLGIWGIRVETAGQGTSTGGSAVVGVKDCRTFRDRVLEERDRVVGESSEHTAGAPPAPPATADAQDSLSAPLLTEVRDALLRIEARIESRVQGGLEEKSDER